MTLGRASEPDEPRSLIRASGVWRRPETSAHAELVWNENVPILKTPDADPRLSALAGETEELGAPEAGSSVAAADDALQVEIARLRLEAFEQLDVELQTRRAELARSLERQRTESEQRIAEVERLETAAIARRREAIEQSLKADEAGVLAERVDAALATQLGDLKQRYAEAETQLRQRIESRQREETARLEQWRVGERERIEAELAAEEQRFNERLMRQLRDFEYQLAERLREQEERLARAWDDAEARAKQQIAALFSPSEA